MYYQINEIRLTPEEYMDRENREKILERKIRKKLRLRGEIRDVKILRESIDARKKPEVRAVYSAAFSCEEKLQLKEWTPAVYRRPEGKAPSGDPAPCDPNPGRRPVIAGFGPAGMFAALILAEAGLRPLVLERGKPCQERIRDVERFWTTGELDPESNVQFGEGGAGTFSDGKLTTGIRDVRIRKVLEELVAAGADPEILYQQKPHIGTDRLREILPNIRRRVTELGGQIRFSTRLEDIRTDNGRISAVITGSGQVIPASCLILAIGHSAEDTFRMLRRHGVEMIPKPFSIGVRVEHLQEKIDRAQYGDPALAEVFGPASYKLNHRCENGRGVYTFCMCPGGRVINAASAPEHWVTNGMSDSARDGKYANSGLLVDVRVEDLARETSSEAGDAKAEDPLIGLAFQQKYEHLAWEESRRQGQGDLPRTTWGQFQKDEKDPVRVCLPAFAAEGICEAMPHLGRKLSGFDDEDTRLTAVETRSSSPVRIPRNEGLESSLAGLIPAGEGPGHAGGIVSAAVDGIRAAEAVIINNMIGAIE